MEEISLKEELKYERRKSLILFFIALVLVAFVFSGAFIIKLGRASGKSMEPNIRDGDFAVVNRLSDKENYERGQIICLNYNGMDVIKRIIGLPGDKITFADGKVYVNDMLLNESDYLSDDVNTICDKKFIVPDGTYFVMGDNRTDSSDSREWDEPYIKYDNIYGDVVNY